MRFHYAEAMADPVHYVPAAQAAESCGFTGMVIADSVAHPADSDARYPYTVDGGREFLEDKPFIESFVLASALAAATTTLRLATFVLKLPIRPPVLVAKQASSLAVLSGNRFSLGVGVSPWAEDYTVTGVPFARRGARMDECIEIVRGLCAGGYFEYHGEFYDIPPVTMTPTPTVPLPILVGGHSDAALRRAVRLGDGWMHAGGDKDDVATLLARIAELRGERDNPAPFEIHVVSQRAHTVEGVRRLVDAGVTDVIVGFRDSTAKIDRMNRYADEVIAVVNR